MSDNCIECVTEKRTGNDLLCNRCRTIHKQSPAKYAFKQYDHSPHIVFLSVPRANAVHCPEDDIIQHGISLGTVGRLYCELKEILQNVGDLPKATK